MMKKIIVLSLLIILFTGGGVVAQHTLIFTHPDELFNQGKELFLDQKFAASYRIFEEFLKKAEPTQAGRIQEADYYLAADAFELRKEDALPLLQNHLDKYPTTPFWDETNAMIGTLIFEKKDYKLALTYFNQVKDQQLGARGRIDFLFNKGYANIETKNFKQSLVIFKELKEFDTRYKLSATYYYAYSAYSIGNYAEALPEFLKMEDAPAYKNIVPYYIVQIYYAQKEYDKLSDRTENLLKNNPDNKNNAEVYRIAGEIAYRKGNYAKAISYLTKYEKLFPQVLRNDMYLLGMSYFQQKDYLNSVLYLSKSTTEKDEMTENAYLHLGNSYVKLNDLVNARLAYEASLRTNFNKAVREEALFNYALSSYETTSAFGESVSAFEQYLAEFPDSKYTEKAYDYLASVYMTSKNYEAAYQSILKIKSPNAKLIETKQYLLYQLGTEAFARNNMEKAIEYFSLSLQSSSTGKYSAECLYWRAESYYRTKQTEKTITDLKAFFNNPYARSSANRTNANYSLAYAYFSRKSYTESLAWFLKYVDAEPNEGASTYSDALNRIGDCYYNARSFAKAQAYYTKAASVSPNTADYALFQAAYVSGLQRNYTGKIAKLESLISQYPKSEYTDDALYEEGRAYLMLENNSKAVETYQRLLDSQPASDLARKAALEIGMIYFNEKDYEHAIAAYKNVIAKYPGTEESFTALESLETVYIDANDVSSYLAYTKTLGLKISNATANREDSISYIASEKQYMNGNYPQAITGMQNYLNKFCPGGRYCTIAQYYMADSYYRTGDKAGALKAYQNLLKITGNQYAEEATVRSAEITYDQKDYASALTYFKQLQTSAQTNENKNVGRLGVLRCSNFLNDYQTTINIVNEIMSDPHSNNELKSEAIYNRAKAYLAIHKLDEAASDLKVLAADTRTANGAEAKYLLANLYFEQEKMTEAEAEVMDFAKKNTPYQFWLARSFVLLADVYIKQNNDFQAKQYLISLQKNYTVADDIQTLIKDRLNAISQREKQTIIN
ncbi:MAG: tetratricopeptide repeat protein [Bacteroidota bacterium]|nr:tetratricopeptide repeat protein [Bacteroidota bacterium]